MTDVDLQNRRKKVVLISAVVAATEVLWKCDLLLNSNNYEDEEKYRKKRNKIERIENYVERNITGMSNRIFQSHFRINRNTFEVLLPLLNGVIKKTSVIGRPKMNAEKQLLAVLWILATPDSYRSVGERFNMGKSSLSKAFFRIINAINRYAPIVIKWPRREEIISITEQFYHIAGVDNIVGAIDGTFVPIKAPKTDPEVYVTRKCNYAFTLQAVCITNLKFIDAFVGYPGSVSDTRIFRNSDLYVNIFENFDTFFPNRDLFIIGDKAYPLLDWCIPPYIDNGNLNASKRNFNLKISQSRQVIERSFALLFGRFRRLKYIDMNTVTFIPYVILACCVLHNVCLANNDIEIDEYINEGRIIVMGNENVENIHRILNRNYDARSGYLKREAICRTLFEVTE